MFASNDTPSGFVLILSCLLSFIILGSWTRTGSRRDLGSEIHSLRGVLGGQDICDDIWRD